MMSVSAKRDIRRESHNGLKSHIQHEVAQCGQFWLLFSMLVSSTPTYHPVTALTALNTPSGNNITTFRFYLIYLVLAVAGPTHNG